MKTEKLISISRSNRLSWSQFFNLMASCYILIAFMSTTYVNCAETKASLNLTSCVVTTVNETVYNLSSLVKNDGDQPWQLNTQMINSFASQHVYINLCRPLPTISPTFLNGGCRDSINSSVCLVNMVDNTTTSFGDFNDSEVSYDNDLEALHIKMKNVNSSTDIYLHCNPSLTKNRPILTHVKKSNRLIIEWFDAAACPKAEIIGDDCSVYVPVIGKVFDLSPLKKVGGYDFPEDGYDYFINVCGPINATGCSPGSGICHYSKDGKMSYSLGKWNEKVIYSDGSLKLIYGDGDPYRDLKKTPRATQILFICNNSVGDGKPDFVKETNRTYIIHWETKHACPKVVHSVDCLWQNSTHRIDLTPFSKSSGNFMVPLKDGIVIINACKPVNPKIHSLPKCPYSAGVCYIPTNRDSNVHSLSLNLGQPKSSPQLLFDDQINLLYTDGDTCPFNKSERYVTRIALICDRNVGEGDPMLISGNPQSCEWLFEWKTSLVCQARSIYGHKCIFEDKLNNLKVDLTQVFSSFPLISEQNNSTIRNFYINVCSVSLGKDYKERTLSKMCANSPICYEEYLVYGEPKYFSLGNFASNSSEYFFQGESLILKFFNGSKCDGSKTWSSEIDIRCSPKLKTTTFVRREFDTCSHTFFLESPLVCGLKPPSCTYRSNDSLIDLRELSSLTHSWKSNASADSRVYYFNLCNKIPMGHIAYDGYSSVVECEVIDGKEHCGYSLGRKDLMTMAMEYNADKSKQNLVITYSNDKSAICHHADVPVKTKIKLICSASYRDPKYIQKIDNETNCEYHFEWETYHACFNHEPERMERKLTRVGNFFIDQRADLKIHMAINMSEIFTTSFGVNDGTYNYTINLSGKSDDPNNEKSDCKNAAICQRKVNGSFERDIGSFDTEMMFTQGSRIKLVLTSNNHQICGKNTKKNVTSIIFFSCSSADSGIGSPRFTFESNNCDYFFHWETDVVCSGKMVSPDLVPNLIEYITDPSASEGKTTSFFSRSKGSATASLFGAFIIVLCIIVFAVAPVAFIVFRLSDRERRNYLVHWIRSKFQPPVITSFHYSQVSSDSTKLVSMNDDL